MLNFVFFKKKELSIPSILSNLKKNKKIQLFSPKKFLSLSQEEKKKVKGILILGGDGTFLRAVPLAYEYELPLIGINKGKFGFLTENYLENLEKILELLEEEKLVFEERTALKISYKDQKFIALNEGVVCRNCPEKLVHLEIKIDSFPLTVVYGDGIIVATPTGSTAYNVSAGGSIIHPKAPVFSITPICAFKLNMKPLIIPDSSFIEITVKTRTKNISLIIDGQKSINVEPFLPISFCKAEKTIKLVPALDKVYYQILKEKFNW